MNTSYLAKSYCFCSLQPLYASIFQKVNNFNNKFVVRSKYCILDKIVFMFDKPCFK